MTRAMWALLCFDFLAYAEHNVMAVPLIAALTTVILKKYIKHKKAAEAFIYIILVINTVYYVFRLNGYF